MLISVLTVSGDRPIPLAFSGEYLSRQNTTYDLEWIVVDDGVTPFKPENERLKYFRRIRGANEHPTYGSLVNNLIYGMEKCSGDYIVMWEDDDWYDKNRIQAQVDAIKDNNLKMHGWINSIYYNVKHRNWYRHANKSHASLYETTFSRELIKPWSERLRQEDTPFVDQTFWTRFSDKQGLYDNPYHCIGMKGCPGRKGLGGGHRYLLHFTKDLELEKLKELIGEDYSKYAGFYEKAKS